MGLYTDDFETHVLALVQRHIRADNEPLVTQKPSRNKKYLSITITIMAESREQLDNIYQDLQQSKRIIMAL